MYAQTEQSPRTQPEGVVTGGRDYDDEQTIAAVRCALASGVSRALLEDRLGEAVEEWRAMMSQATSKRNLRRIQRACAHEWKESLHCGQPIRTCAVCLASQFAQVDGTYTDRKQDTFIGNEAMPAIITGELPDGRAV